MKAPQHKDPTKMVSPLQRERGGKPRAGKKGGRGGKITSHHREEKGDGDKMETLTDPRESVLPILTLGGTKRKVAKRKPSGQRSGLRGGIPWD